jgi:hypothetical protein
MSAAFDRDALLDAFDQIGRAAVEAGTKLQIAVYGGSALMLASNFRFATEDVDIRELGTDWPEWLSQAVTEIAAKNGWSATWFNDAVLAEFFPRSAADADKQRFVLKRLLAGDTAIDAPQYPRTDG